MRLWRPEGPIPESVEDKRMCKDPSLDVRPRAWATRITNSSPGLVFPPLQCTQRGSSQELITPQPTGLCRAPEASTAEGYGPAGCFREGLTGSSCPPSSPLQALISRGRSGRGGKGASFRGFCSPSWLHLCVFERDFGLFPGEGPKTPKLANLASPQLRK